jgi:hypothetical protein
MTRDGYAVRESSPDWKMHEMAEQFRVVSSARRQMAQTIVLIQPAPPGGHHAAESRAVADGSPHRVSCTDQAPAAERSPTPFDDIFASVSTPIGSAGAGRVIDAPPSRFMVRESKVIRPHRTTKRNYDYFEELNVALAEKRRGQRSPE